MARADPRDRSVRLDRNVPVLVMRIGHYPLHHGTVGVLRSFGRAGVPAYVVTEDRFTPAARSRYATGRFVWPISGTEPAEELVAGLRKIGERIGRRALVVVTDDEAAVFLAEHARELGEHFIVPAVAPGLPRTLASKRTLDGLCSRLGVDTPSTRFPLTAEDVARFAKRARFPVMAKNVDPFLRLQRPAVRANTVVRDAFELAQLAANWREPFGVALQEYIPTEVAEDWIVHGYFDERSEPLALFSGVKIRSWPPYAGVTTYARVVENDALRALAARLCKQLGYRGICDLDWRYDRRDGRYKLLDFNPRVGAQFRLFESAAGVDVVRAMHLDLTGRRVPPGGQVNGAGYLVEHLDAPAVAAYATSRVSAPVVDHERGSVALAWFAPDDLLPFGLALGRTVGTITGRLARRAAHAVAHPERARDGR